MISYTSYDNDTAPLFSILIPSWNNLEYLKLCVESIRKNSRYPHQIILHVNEGSDGTLGWVQEQQIDHTFSNKNVGVCYALNAARSLAKTDYIAYLNDDMYVCPDWDHYLLEEIRALGHDYFFLSSTAIEPKDVGKGCALAPFDFGRSPADFNEKGLLEACKTLQYNDWNGASWPPNIVHRRLWDLIGGYSTEFSPGFYSDPDFSMKLWHAGVRIFKGVGSSKVYHFLEVSTNKLKKKAVKRANLLFTQKWGISARMFNHYYLRMGIPCTGPLAEPGRTAGFKGRQFICDLKRRLFF